MRAQDPDWLRTLHKALAPLNWSTWLIRAQVIDHVHRNISFSIVGVCIMLYKKISEKVTNVLKVDYYM